MRSVTEAFRIALPYRPDGARLFAPLAERPWSMFFDSGPPDRRTGRFDIIVSDPLMRLETRGETTFIHSPDARRQSTDDPFALLDELLTGIAVEAGELPFVSGAAGYLGYDLGRRIERLPSLAEDDEQLPTMAMGIYDWAVVLDHERHECWLTGETGGRNDPARRQQLVKLFTEPPAVATTRGFQVTGEIRADLDRQSYAQAYRRIERYIVEGDCYQVNLAQRFTAECVGDPWMAYCALRQVNPAPFGAYLNLPDVQVLSCSPERFIEVRDGLAQTRPIKGTRPRSADPGEDEALRSALARSEKDRAENVMIVDLLRNDFGKTCQPGSVRAPELFAVESFATVHHLVSTVEGRLATGVSTLDLLRGCFPGGSITGAPKLRAMEIIEELEPHRRGVYCGGIGYIGADGSMDMNIAIRTLTHQRGKLHFWAGGGIVHDSTLEGEYQECFDKAAAMLSLFQPRDQYAFSQTTT